MLTRPPLKKVLIIGAGPVRIGQTGAFDIAACRVCDSLRKAGIESVMVHSDPSALAAEVDAADRTYMVPLTASALAEVIEMEKPDALLPTVGGPTALGLTKELVQDGILKGNGIRLLGITEKTLALIGDPPAFCDAVGNIGLALPEGQSAASVADAAAIAEKIGYPVFIRTVKTGAPVRYGIAFNVEELRRLTANGRLRSDITGSFRIEAALYGHHEVEVEMLRDADNHVQIVAMAENMDPVGIHSGDSVVVLPPIGISEKVCRQIESVACKLAESTGVTGSLHLKVAVAPETNQLRILALDPRFSRMSALCAKALDIDLAAVHARLSLGTVMDEALAGERARIDAARTGETVALRLPRWEFERYPGEAPKLDARMKSTGECLGLGRTFLQALQKAVRSRSPRNPLLGLRPELTPLSTDVLMRKLVSPSPDRLYILHEALKKGATPKALADVTGIGIEWLRQLAELADLEQRLVEGAGSDPTAALFQEAVACGYCTAGLSGLLGISKSAVAHRLGQAPLAHRPSAAGDADSARVWFNSSTGSATRHTATGKHVLIVGPGCGRIGQNIDLDNCCVHGAKALQTAGRRVVMVGANPGSACGINNADRTYIEPLTAADIEAVCHAENPEGVILQFGGSDAMNLAGSLVDAGFPVLGTAHADTILSQDRLQFSDLLTDLGIPHPQIGMADSPEAAMDLAEHIGYPLSAGARIDRQGIRRTIIMDCRMLEEYVIDATVSAESPLLLEQFLEYAIEVQADALCDGENVYIPGIMEHIELAGVHSGDSAIVAPPYSTPPRHVETVGTYIREIALALNIKGLINARFAVYNDTVYLLEARPWAGRTLPLISKICNVPMARRAVEIMMGVPLDEMDLPRRLLPHYGIRASVFPFDTFPETDPLLGPRMLSTGQVMALADVFGMAYFTSQESAGVPLPLTGNVLITVTDADKPSILEPARLFKEMGFGIQSTRGTHAFLKKNGIAAQSVKKLGFGRPDLVDAIKTGEVAIVVNTPSGSRSQQDDAYIRKTAIQYRIPNITTPAGALAAAKGIAARKRGQDALHTLQAYVRAIK